MPLVSSETTEDETTTVESSVENTVKETVVTNVPDIELIIEDGSGVSNANSYVDLDYAIEYCTMKGYTDWLSLSENEQKINLIRGTEFVDNYYTWKGYAKTPTQSMAFPRVDIYDINRFRVEGIPEKLKKACIEAAWLNTSSSSETLFSTKDENGQVKRQKVDSLEVEYFSTSNNVSSVNSQVDYTTLYDILNKLLKGLYVTKTNGSRVCSRAIHTGW